MYPGLLFLHVCFVCAVIDEIGLGLCYTSSSSRSSRSNRKARYTLPTLGRPVASPEASRLTAVVFLVLFADIVSLCIVVLAPLKVRTVQIISTRAHVIYDAGVK